MSKEGYEFQNDEFDFMLADSLSEQVSGEVVNGVTPWRRAMNNILIGLAMNVITFNFLCLDYILPTIGMIMMLLGFRTLNKENIWFKACYVITVIRMVYFIAMRIIDASVYQSEIYELPLISFMMYINLALIFVMLFCLRRAIREVQIKAGLLPHTGGMTAMIVWYALISLIGLSGLEIGFFSLFILVAYIFIIRSLMKTSKELDEAGYMVQSALVKISDGLLTTIIVTILTAGIICSVAFFGKYHMEWTRQNKTEHNEVAHIKTQLVELGFPKDILEDLTAEEIKSCEGALKVVTEAEYHPVNDGYVVETQDEDGIYRTREYAVKELKVTGVAVRLPGDVESWRIFHHFIFVENPGFYGTEAVWLWPAYRDSSKWKQGSEVTGRVLYTKNDVDYVAPYYSLASETYTSKNILFGETTETDVFGAFSMPHGGESHRGYVSYEIDVAEEGWLINAWINFVHQKSILNYPAITAKESQKIDLGDTWVFELVQDQLLFDPWE